MALSTISAILDKWCENSQENETSSRQLKEIINKCHKIDVKYSNDLESCEAIQDVLEVAKLFMSYTIHSSEGNLENLITSSTTYISLICKLGKKHSMECVELTLSEYTNCLNEKGSKPNQDIFEFQILERRLTTFIASLTQSDLLEPSSMDYEELKQSRNDVICKIFDITAKKCLTYSCCTYLHFKNFNCILTKLITWEDEKLIDDNRCCILFYVICNNWENLVSGVRELNVKLWGSLLRIFHKNNLHTSQQTIMDSVMEFPWTKAKYFALSEIISFHYSDMIGLIQNYPMIICGLRYSLEQTPLTSAGTTLYKVLINKIDTQEKWRVIFLDLFKSVLLSKDILAKRNISNYWISKTMKKFPGLLDTFLNIFLDYGVENNYSSFLSFVKYCRKNGLLLSDWMNEEENSLRDKVCFGLVHIEEDVRAEAFNIVCETSKQNTPCEEELFSVKNFLEMNINDDSTPHRQKNLNSFNVFMIRIHDSYLRLMKQNKFKELKNLDEFLLWIHGFLIYDNLKDGGNYQRKIMSLSILRIILQCLSSNDQQSDDKTRRYLRKGNHARQGYKIVQYIREFYDDFFTASETIEVLFNFIEDNADDVRECAVRILEDYFTNHDEFACFLLTHDMSSFAKKNIDSHLFYKNESGCLLVRIMTHIKLSDGVLTHADLLCKCVQQFENEKEDVLSFLYKKQSLHGAMSALNTQFKYSAKYIDYDFILLVKCLLNSVTNFYINILALKSSSGIFPPSFAEMGESIEELISSSRSKYPDKHSTVSTTSDIHQLVLNYIWLNLKSCCELSNTLLTKINVKSSDVFDLLDVCVRVLTKCRHKGAIEAAGVCLGASVSYLTSINEAEVYNKVSKWLEELLLDFISESQKSGSVTRRSAGLTILVHKVVTNDSQNEKPLFHLSMKIMLKALSCKSSECQTRNQAGPDEGEIDIANERDIPLARMLHLLCRTVCDSSLSSFILQYAPQLTDVCFQHLTSEQWQIRNAALQLYGALVPKLIGQKKAHGDDASEAPVSVDELFCHMPALQVTIETQLKEACSKKDVISHSNIIPILSLLSSTGKRYYLSRFISHKILDNFSIQHQAIENLFPYFIELVGSSVYVVRNTSAKIINLFYCVNAFKKEIRDDFVYSENKLHGFLLTFKHFVLDYFASKTDVLHVNEKNKYFYCLCAIFVKLENIKISRQRSFVVETIFTEIQQLLLPQTICDFMQNQLLLYNIGNMKMKPGFHQWLLVEVSFILKYCDDTSLTEVIQRFFCQSVCIELDHLIEVKWRLLNKPLTDISLAKSLLGVLLKIAKSERPDCKKAFEIMYIIFSQTRDLRYPEFTKLLVDQDNLETIIEQNSHSFLLPLLCCIAERKADQKFSNQSILILSKKCKFFSNPDCNDAETRYISALSLNHLKSILKNIDKEDLPGVYDIQKNLLISFIRILQDENSAVRKECAKTPLSQFDDKIVSASNQLHNILWNDFISNRELGEEIINELSLESANGISNYLLNPFKNQASNIYWEPDRIKEAITNLSFE